MGDKIAGTLVWGRDLMVDDVIVGYSVEGYDGIEKVLSILRITGWDIDYVMATHRRAFIHIIWAEDEKVHGLDTLLVEDDTKYMKVVPALYGDIELEDPRVVEM